MLIFARDARRARERFDLVDRGRGREGEGDIPRGDLPNECRFLRRDSDGRRVSVGITSTKKERR